MSIITWIRNLRNGEHRSASAYDTVYRALVEGLCRQGVKVGTTAGYPRVEVHSLQEGRRLDKGGRLRLLTFEVDSISSKGIAECVAMNAYNLERLLDYQPTLEGVRWIGCVAQMLTDAVEQSDTQKAVYRITQAYDLYVEIERSINNNNNN